MNKKSIIVLLVLVLALSGLFAKDSGIKVGGQLGWGFDTLRTKSAMLQEDSSYDNEIQKWKNNGFAFNLTGEYDFDKNWAVVANVGMMFAGKTTTVMQDDDGSESSANDKRAGLYIDVALDAKYSYAINEKVSVAGLAGLELVSGYFLKTEIEYMGTGPLPIDSDYYNVAFGLNLGLEGSYKITDDISVTGGATGAWFFVNTSKAIKDYDSTSDPEDKFSVASFYIRPYIGVTYAL